MTPRPRTVTSGFHDFERTVLLIAIAEVIESAHLVGQLLEQNRVPTQRL